MEKDKSEIKWTPRAKILAKIGKVALAGGALIGGYAWANAGQQSPNLSHDPKVKVVISPEIPSIDAAITDVNKKLNQPEFYALQTNLVKEYGNSVYDGEVVYVPQVQDSEKK